MVVASGCWEASGEAEALGEGLEPLPPEHPLWDAENLILTPHVAGRSISPYIIEATGDLFIENFSAFLENRPFRTPVDRETGYMVSRT